MKIERSKQSEEIREKMRGGEGHAVIRRLSSSDALPANCRLVAEITLDPGCSIGVHEHKGETEIFYFTSGTGLADDNGTPVDVSPGDVLVTGDASHGIANTGDEPLIFTAVIILH